MNKMWHVIRSKPNGDCLFISLYLGLEFHAILKDPKKNLGILDGFHALVLGSALKLKECIIQWFDVGLDKELKTFDSIHSENKITRGDLLVMESVNIFNTDVPDDALQKRSTMLRYLERLKRPATWGGAPEYTAFAFMSKLTVEVYQKDPRGQILMVNRVGPETDLGTVKLLFSSNNHYDLLLDSDTASKLKLECPGARVRALITS